MRVLAITKLFPNATEPLLAPFNRQQFSALSSLCDLEVMATIPWWPGQLVTDRARRAAARIPSHEVIDDLSVHHPRTLYMPRYGRILSAPLHALSLMPHVHRYRGKVDVILAAWAYPDGCAAVMLGQLLSVPVVVKLHGSDINVVASMPGPRWMIQRLLPKADGVVAVSEALAREVTDLGVDPQRIHVVMNGVDASLFHLRRRDGARQRLGLDDSGPLALYVGNLKENKGVLDLLAAYEVALAERGDLRLAVVGDGPARQALADRVRDLPGLSLVGSRPLAEIPDWMAACDFLVLPSWNEGTPNVVLEALSCGRRVLATRVGGVPDLLTDKALGQLVPPQDPAALGRALVREADTDYSPQEIRDKGSRGDWDQSAAALYGVLSGVHSSACYSH